MVRRLIWVLPFLLCGCLAGQRTANERYLVESHRDLADDPEDDDAILRQAEKNEKVAAGLKTAEDLTLPGCLRLAMVQSEELRIRGERILQAEAVKAETIAEILPHADAFWRYSRDSDAIKFGGQTFSPKQRTEYWFTASQLVFDGRVIPAIGLADESLRIEALHLRTDRDRLFFQVAATFYETLSLEEDVKAVTSSRARSVELLRVLRVRKDAGEAQQSEILLARARFDEVESRLIQITGDLDRARARLARLTGVDPFTANLRDTFTLVDGPDEIPHLVEQALRMRYDFEIATLEIERAKDQRNLVLARYLPWATLNFTHWTKVEGIGELVDWTVSLDAQWNLLDGGGREASLTRTRSVIRERELQRQSLEKEIRLQVEDAVIAFRALDAAMAAFESRARAAKESQELTTKQFQAGEATNLDMLVGAEVLEDAERNLARAGFALKLSALRIRLAIGDLRFILEEDR